MEKDYLKEIIDLFISKERRGRFHDLLSVRRRYNDFLHDMLHDPRYFDSRCVIELPANEQLVDRILQKLTDFGAKSNCYIASIDSDWTVAS